ncbi:MAG: CPBP family glutamic-type intramembrane protease [Saprospiraceae bacterium]
MGIALLFLLASIGLAFTNKEIKQMLLSEHSVAGQLHLLGLNPVSTIILLITALIKTSLSEEILFRGFIAKRAINRWGFGPGNLLQALLFGLIHLLLFWLIAKTPILPCVFIFTFSSLAAWLIGHNMIRNGNGSIIPGWISHGAGNALAYFMLAFVI